MIKLYSPQDLYYQKVGGKWVKPYQPAGVWKELANQIGENKYRPSKGKDLYQKKLIQLLEKNNPASKHAHF